MFISLFPPPVPFRFLLFLPFSISFHGESSRLVIFLHSFLFFSPRRLRGFFEFSLSTNTFSLSFLSFFGPPLLGRDCLSSLTRSSGSRSRESLPPLFTVYSLFSTIFGFPPLPSHSLLRFLSYVQPPVYGGPDPSTSGIPWFFDGGRRGFSL